MTDLNTARELAHAAAMVLPWVQVRIDTVTTCARLLDTWTSRDQVEFSKLDLHTPFKGVAHFPSARVRACSGVDGRCFCSDEPLQPMSARSTAAAATEGPRLRGCGAQADARSAPLGNHGDNNLPATPASVSLFLSVS
ncbi:hypothetical protein J2X19_002311 [Rhodoferax ferrireducens]|uniref:Uncharacterized protein n=1 Tax=Rhodoferax ferrireducens TaxID=192843 RepID=A0ABU2C8G3_9BURK|nr:hypothetical protein [Rhodoferax ferrireducens]MDR7377632.1 hypothetical protein [Rhodoferax ferrireducens]